MAEATVRTRRALFFGNRDTLNQAHNAHSFCFADGNDERCVIRRCAHSTRPRPSTASSCCDYLSIGSTRYQGSQNVSRTRMAAQDTIQWRSDYSVTSGGFTLRLPQPPAGSAALRAAVAATLSPSKQAPCSPGKLASDIHTPRPLSPASPRLPSSPTAHALPTPPPPPIPLQLNGGQYCVVQGNCITDGPAAYTNNQRCTAVANQQLHAYATMYNVETCRDYVDQWRRV